MKNKIITFMAAGLFFSALEFAVADNSAKNSSFLLQQSQVPITHLYGKKLQVGHHTKNKVKVGHKGTDYVMFSENGDYVHNWNGIETKGRWSYDQANNALVVVTGGSNTWVIKKVEDTKLSLENGNEVIGLFVPGK